MGNSQAAQGLGHGLAGLVGLGSVYDPLGGLQAQLANSIQNFNSTTAQYAFKSLQLEGQSLANMEKLINGNAVVAKNQLQNTSQMLWDNLENTNLFVIFVYMLIFIVIIYLVVSK